VSLINSIKMIKVVEEAKMNILRLGNYSRKCLLEAPHDLEFPGEAYCNKCEYHFCKLFYFS
jgi:hypothetical protein